MSIPVIPPGDVMAAAVVAITVACMAWVNRIHTALKWISSREYHQHAMYFILPDIEKIQVMT